MQQDRFARMGAELITVSTDTEFVHLAWKRDEKELADVRYAMVADLCLRAVLILYRFNHGGWKRIKV